MRRRYMYGFQPKRKRFHVNKTILKIAGGVVAAAIVVVALVLLSGRTTTSLEKLNIQPGSKISVSSKAIFSLNGTTLTSSDYSGKKNWSVSFNAADMKLSNSENLICVYNEATANVMGTDKSLGVRIDATDFTIKKVVCGNTAIAMLTESLSEDKTQYIRIFNSEGIDLYREQIVNSQVLDFGFYSGGNFWYLKLDVSGVIPISRVTMLNPEQNSIIGTIDVTDEIITDVFFFSDDIYLSGTTTLKSYSLSNLSMYQNNVLIYGLNCIDTLGSQAPVFLYTPHNSSNSDCIQTLRLISKNSSDTTIRLQDDVRFVVALHDKIFCFKDYSYDLYSLDGSYISTSKLQTNVLGVQKLSDNYALITGESQVYMLSVK